MTSLQPHLWLCFDDGLLVTLCYLRLVCRQETRAQLTSGITKVECLTQLRWVTADTASLQEGQATKAASRQLLGKLLGRAVACLAAHAAV